MANATKTQLQELYLAYFGRPGDPMGLDYWVGVGITQRNFACGIYEQYEYQYIFENKSIAEQVNHLYKNLFCRDADIQGLLYWTNKVYLGELLLCNIAIDLVWAARNNIGSENDKKTLQERVDWCNEYTNTVNMSTTSIASYQPISTDPWVDSDLFIEVKEFLANCDLSADPPPPLRRDCIYWPCPSEDPYVQQIAIYSEEESLMKKAVNDYLITETDDIELESNDSICGCQLNMTVGEMDVLTGIKDYDGNLHGFLGEAPSIVKSSYKYQGKLDVNNDGITEAIYTNKESGRWVTASIDAITGGFHYGKHGQGGTTRIVGIYEDPLVAAGLVEKNSDLDSSHTFINDLKLDNLILKTVGDYDGDNFQEVYWSKVDNTAYLRAVMHSDGNIQYANYQNLDQMTDYLTSNGFADTVALIC